MQRTEYRVEIEDIDHDLCPTREVNLRTLSRQVADRRAKDLAAAGYNGRIVTRRGKVVYEWRLAESSADARVAFIESLCR